MSARSQNPELGGHLRAIEESNRLAREWTVDDRLEEIIRLSGLVQSHLISADQAASRREEPLLGYHLSRAWAELQTARKDFKALSSEAGEGA